MCIGCPSAWICCGHKWGKCICKKPGWNSCCKRIIDPACKSANAACSRLRSAHGVSTDVLYKASFWKKIKKGVKKIKKKVHHGIKKGLQKVRHGITKGVKKLSSGIKRGFNTIKSFALKAVKRARDLLNKAKDILKKAQSIVSLARKAWDKAKKALNYLKNTVGAIALKALKTLLSNKIINIIEMHFKVELGKAVGGRFLCQVKGILLGKRFSLHLDFDTRNIFSLVKSIAEKAISGLSKFIG